MPRRTRKIHFPKPARGRTLCGIYVVGGGMFVNTGIRITANFNEVDCDECRKHKAFTEALYQFEIGEYSWPEWLATYAPPPQLKEKDDFSFSRVQNEQAVESGADLLAKFEARSKRK